MIHYPIPHHLQPAYSKLAFKKGDFPITELIHEQILSLPIGPLLTLDQVEYVAHTVKSILLKPI
jgi:dTDP-4-amino-4,6-dideoxygalactose transaminase